MIDRTGTAFCDPCANDAGESGLFDDNPNFYSSDEPTEAEPDTFSDAAPGF